MRILFISNDFPHPGNPTRGVFNLNLVRALSACHQVQVISPIPWVEHYTTGSEARRFSSAKPRWVEGIEVFHPTYHYVPKLFRESYGWFYWQSIRKTVWHVMETGLPEIVVGYWIHPDGEAAVRAARIAGVPSAVLVGGSDLLLLPREPGRRACVIDVLEKADAVLTVSDHLRNKALEMRINPAKVYLWRQGVDLARFSPGNRGQARQKLGLKADDPVMLWVGRMVPVKALEVLLAACALLRDRGAAFRMCLVGDGPLRRELQTQVAIMRLEDRIQFVGVQAQDVLPDWYRAADIMVLPSWSEGLPNVLREARACGTPFVASSVGGIPEIANPATDMLVTEGNAEALAAALEYRLKNPLRSVEAGASLSWESSAQALVGLLQPLVKAAEDVDQPWWIRRPSPLEGAVLPGGGPSTIRQAIRRTMAALLPIRLFAVHGPLRSRQIALTFDDGPHPINTPRVLDALLRLNVRATFFVVGRMAARYPQIIKRMVAEGHQVASHGLLHTRAHLMSAQETVASAQRSLVLINAAGGRALACFRPPHGKVTMWKLWRLWCDGFTVALWNVDPKDYSCANTAELMARLRGLSLHGGDIMLLHDRLPYAADALPDFVQQTRQAGLEFGTLDTWIGRRLSRNGQGKG